jgi:pimeloyl-ACP methyl ester carboxylesterase
VAGFSFGARTALELAAVEPRVARVLAVGMATRLFDLSVAESLHQPVAVIQSARDEFASVEDVRGLVARIPHARLFELPDADHLVTAKQREFDAVCATAVHWLLETS